MTVHASALRFCVLSLAVLAVGCSGSSGTTGSSSGTTAAAGTTVTGAGTSSTTSGPGTTDGALTTSGAVTTTGATTGATSSSGSSSGSTSGASTSGSITTVGASTGATTGAATSSGSITTTGASTAGATTVAAATSGAGTTTSGGGTTSSSTTGGTPVACIPDGDWSGQTVTCNGTVASNYVPGTFELDVDAGYGTFIQTFPIGAGGCKFLAPGPISCFTDGGGTFTQVTFTQTGPSSCEPAGCGMNLSLCSANPGSPINWSLTGDSASGFTLTSVDPNALTTCTSDSLSNPIEITWSAQ